MDENYSLAVNVLTYWSEVTRIAAIYIFIHVLKYGEYVWKSTSSQIIFFHLYMPAILVLKKGEGL